MNTDTPGPDTPGSDTPADDDASYIHDVHPATIAMGVMMGLLAPAAGEPGVWEMTAKGEAVLLEHISEQSPSEEVGLQSPGSMDADTLALRVAKLLDEGVYAIGAEYVGSREEAEDLNDHHVAAADALAELVVRANRADALAELLAMLEYDDDTIPAPVSWPDRNAVLAALAVDAPISGPLVEDDLPCRGCAEGLPCPGDCMS